MWDINSSIIKKKLQRSLAVGLLFFLFIMAVFTPLSLIIFGTSIETWERMYLSQGTEVGQRLMYPISLLLAALIRGLRALYRVPLDGVSFLDCVKLVFYPLATLASVGAAIWSFFKEYTLMTASFHGHTEAVKALLEKGADVNVKNEIGTTALMLASDKGHTEIVQLLKKAGAKE